MRVPLIFVLEDDMDDEKLTVRAIEREFPSAFVVVASGGQEAVQTLGLDRESGLDPDLAILDIKVPRLDGFEVLKLLRGHPRLTKTRVVVFSSSCDEEDAKRAADLGAELIRKPLDPADYTAQVCEIVRTRLSSSD